MEDAELAHIKELLDVKYDQFNRPLFIEKDPISIPHLFENKVDVEISGFLTAIISWGNRAAILKSAAELMNRMGGTPYDFVIKASDTEIKDLTDFYYRTFQGADIVSFVYGLRNIYLNFGGLHSLFSEQWKLGKGIEGGLSELRKNFFTTSAPLRSYKHLASVEKGASCKRLNMFLRWMIRNDNRGVDFGIWKDIPTSALYLPLDVHTGNVARKLGLLKRKANDWKAVQEVTDSLRLLDATDPVKYDFALFGMGVEKLL